MTAAMTQIRDDLWQTRTESPFPGLTTHAYVWRGPNGNILFYSPASDADFEAIQELGGVSAQYLSHLDEAGPMLARVADRFGSRLHAPAPELDAISRHARVDVPVEARRHVDETGHCDFQCLRRRFGVRDGRQRPVATVRRRSAGERADLS
jgi:hypothetical protein